LNLQKKLRGQLQKRINSQQYWDKLEVEEGEEEDNAANVPSTSAASCTPKAKSRVNSGSSEQRELVTAEMRAMPEYQQLKVGKSMTQMPQKCVPLQQRMYRLFFIPMAMQKALEKDE
jgi:hypothetical protein